MTRLITLTTDFGQKGPFVGVMKGVILRHAPDVRVIDLTHEIFAHWPAEAGFWLARAYRYFPPGTVHVAVVDPGVGTSRDILAACFDGHVVLAPDNGLLPQVIGAQDARIFRLADDWLAARNWPVPSHTFHGRDIFAPLAAGIATGSIAPADIGPETSDLVPSLIDDATEDGGEVRGCVIAIDHFGNLITNIGASLLVGIERPEVDAGGYRLTVRETYGDVPPGEYLALINSFGVLEIARAEGSAAEGLGLGHGAPVAVTSRPA